MDVLIKVTLPSRDGVSEGAEGGEGALGEQRGEGPSRDTDGGRGDTR